MLLMIDNYDSFTYNLVHYFQVLGQTVQTHRHDKISLEDIRKLDPQYIVLSPGPKNPLHAGICLDVIDQFSQSIPTLGVCLGHQCIGHHFGGDIIHAKTIMHGKSSTVTHHNEGVFKDLENDFSVTRYHSLVIDERTLPECLTVTARSEDNEIMGVKHVDYPIEGVQFHPESVTTEQGYALLDNFLKYYD